MKKLALKDIAGYFPYELHCLNCDDMIEMIDFCNIGNLMRGIELQDEAEDDEWVASQQYKPILRPLSDLYRTITHNGKEIIPVVGLAKVTYPDLRWNIEDSEQKENGGRLQIKNYRKTIYVATDKGKVIREIINMTNTIHDNAWYPESYDYLNSLKIDYRGLIDAGLAIDCNTLENNPY